MSANLQKVMGNQRGNKIAVKKVINRGGKSFQQTFWLSPKKAAAFQKKQKAEMEGFQKSAGGVLEKMGEADRPRMEIHPHANRRLNELYRQGKLTADGVREVTRYAEQGAAHYGHKIITEVRIRDVLEERPELLQEPPQDWKQKGLSLPIPNPPNPFPERLDVDESALESLDLYIDNSGFLYERTRARLERQATEEWKNKTYDEKEFVQGIRNSELVNEGADLYRNEVPEDDGTYFDGPLREQLERDMARRFTEALEAGEYGEGGHKPPSGAKQAIKNWAKKGKKKGFVLASREQREWNDGAENIGVSVADLEEAYAAPEGYEVEIMDVDTRAGGGYDPASLYLAGKIYDDDGVEMGDMKRTLTVDDAGDLHVEHNLLWLKDAAQDTGLGTKMILNQFEQYESMGVSSVSLDAARVGKYLWMKLGFVPTETDADEIRRYAATMIDDTTLLDEDQKDLLYDVVGGDLNQLARMPGLPEVEYHDHSGRLQTAPFNKAVFLNRGSPGWSGTIEVGGDDWGTTKEILNGYVQG